MGDFNFDLQNKNLRFSEFMEHSVVSKLCLKSQENMNFVRLSVSKGLPCQVLPGERLQLSRASSLLDHSY
jgi:hypothetical protein